ncbi:MAG TPA: ABC transporter transmembrane domain-containing protein, partial [Gemmataceae bacterium]|nr:ABC transporter transmembrane domain-containing protein [Gemmataceae bacterium]
MTGTTDAWDTLPQGHRHAVENQLEPGETLLAWFEPDLDQRLFYNPGLVVLTDRRLLAVDTDPLEGNSPTAPATPRWQTWLLEADTTLRASEHAGVGALEWLAPAGRLAHWRYTAGRGPAAQRLVLRATALRDARAGAAGPGLVSVCPSCGTVLGPDETQCPVCAPTSGKPPLSALYRLAAFARPRAGLIVLGFCLTLTSTALGLVPPLLTWPLLDNVLVPYQAHKQADFSLVVWYLSGLAGAAAVAWLLDWGRVYVLATVSERVSADLRMRTYAHLQRLSLEFFGGKRTGDLMSRVGNDTDRLCNFLSINLVDFSTDMLMMVMVAAILLTIDPLLALVTLAPFPIIVGMVYWVRSRLRHGFRQAAVVWAEMLSVLADAIPGI